MKVDLTRFNGKTLIFNQEEHRSELSTEQFVKVNAPNIEYAWINLDQHVRVYAPKCVDSEVQEELRFVLAEIDGPTSSDFITLPDSVILSVYTESEGHVFFILKGPESPYAHRQWFYGTLKRLLEGHEGLEELEAYWELEHSYPEMIMSIGITDINQRLLNGIYTFFDMRLRQAGWTVEQVGMEFILNTPPCKSEIRFIFDDELFVIEDSIAQLINTIAGRVVHGIEQRKSTT